MRAGHYDLLGLCVLCLKRVNFNMAPECHRLLKATCAILDVSVSEFCYQCIAEKFRQLCKEYKRFLTLLMNEKFKAGSPAYSMKEEFKDHLID